MLEKTWKLLWKMWIVKQISCLCPTNFYPKTNSSFNSFFQQACFYLRGREREERERAGEKETPTSTGSLHKCLKWQGLSWARAGSRGNSAQAFHVGSRNSMNHYSHCLWPVRVWISRKLESAEELGIDFRYLEVRCRHLKQCLNCQAEYQPLHKLYGLSSTK